jgi:hypothetical protein
MRIGRLWILVMAAAPPAASDGRCLSRPMPGRRGCSLPVRLLPFFLFFVRALPAVGGHYRP